MLKNMAEIPQLCNKEHFTPVQLLSKLFEHLAAKEV